MSIIKNTYSKKRAFLDGFLQSFSYFSILPIRLKTITVNKEFYSATLFTFPLVGLILGTITLLIFYLLQKVFILHYAAFISSIVYIILYGCLHLEAISDVIDAWFASFSNKDIKAIMKEPQVGAIGAIGTMLIVLLKVGGITYLFIIENYTLFLSALILSRLCAIIELGIFDFKGAGKFTLQLSLHSNLKLMLSTGIFYMLILTIFLDISTVIILVIFSLSLSLLLLLKLKSTFGFVNGDCIGFTLIITEIALFNYGLII